MDSALVCFPVAPASSSTLASKSKLSGDGGVAPAGAASADSFDQFALVADAALDPIAIMKNEITEVLTKYPVDSAVAGKSFVSWIASLPLVERLLLSSTYLRFETTRVQWKE